jgi:hypothetical protein
LREPAGVLGVGSSAVLGVSISIFINQPLNKLRSANDALAARKTGNFHVAIIKNIYLDALANQSQSNQNGIIAMARKLEMNLGGFQPLQQIK